MTRALFLSTPLLFAAASWAQRLPTTVVPERYTLVLSPDLEKESFEGDETIQVRVAESTNAVTLNAAEIAFADVSIAQGGKKQKATVTLDPALERATFTVEAPLSGGPAEVRVHYTGKLNGDLRGFYLSKTPRRKYAVTQFENTDARRAFPCWDEPAFKAVFDLTLIIERADVAISNGRVVSDKPGPTAHQHTLVFAPSAKMSTYLLAFAVGDFQCEASSSDGIPIRVCATPEGKGHLSVALDAAKHVLHFYDGYFGAKYPYGKLDFLAMPDFQAGAMENAGFIIGRDLLLQADPTTSYPTRKVVSQQAVAHEMAHQWFGDLVTMKWWDDVWLNEGFATWMAFKPIEAWHPEWNIASDAAQSSLNAMGFDALAATHPIHQPAETPAQIKELFDSVSYDKTAAVLRMVEGFVGPDAFRRGVNAYLRKYAYANASAADFWTEIAHASKQPADAIMESFVMQPGVPFVDLKVSRCTEGRVNVELTQTRYFADKAKFDKGGPEQWKIPVCLRAGKERTCTLLGEKSVTVGLKSCEPIVANADANGYYISGYQPEHLKRLAQISLGQLSAPERIRLVGDAAAGLRVGRLTASDFLEFARALESDSERGVLDQLAGELAVIDDRVVSDADRPLLQRWIRRNFGPVAGGLGWDARAGEPEERKALRATLWQLVGFDGRDPDAAKRARALVEADLRGEPTDATLLNTAVQIAAASGDGALFDGFVKEYAAARTPESGWRYLQGLGAFEDPALVQRALEYALTPAVRTQDVLNVYGTLLNNRMGRKATWTFTKAHWKELTQRMPEAHLPYFIQALGLFCDAATRQDVQAFLTAHPVAAAVRAQQQALEAMDNCVQRQGREQRALGDWLRAEHGEVTGK